MDTTKHESITRRDLSVERNPVNGSWQVSAIVNGYRVHQTFYGYTKAESIRYFLEEINKEGSQS